MRKALVIIPTLLLSYVPFIDKTYELRGSAEWTRKDDNNIYYAAISEQETFSGVINLQKRPDFSYFEKGDTIIINENTKRSIMGLTLEHLTGFEVEPFSKPSEEYKIIKNNDLSL